MRNPSDNHKNTAGLSMLGGILAFVFLWAYNLSFQTFLREDQAFIRFITSRKFLLVALTLGAVHVFFMGYAGWLTPSSCHGGLPPISLVAFVCFVVGYVVNFLGREQRLFPLLPRLQSDARILRSDLECE